MKNGDHINKINYSDLSSRHLSYKSLNRQLILTIARQHTFKTYGARTAQFQSDIHYYVCPGYTHPFFESMVNFVGITQKNVAITILILGEHRAKNPVIPAKFH